jgi:hypothetical protein
MIALYILKFIISTQEIEIKHTTDTLTIIIIIIIAKQNCWIFNINDMIIVIQILSFFKFSLRDDDNILMTITKYVHKPKKYRIIIDYFGLLK